MIYAQKYGVSRASRKYNKSRSFIYFWMARYDGTLESLACRSRRPHSADFLKRAVKWFARRGVHVECIQTDNGFEFTNRFSPSKKHLLTLFEATAAQLHIRHKLIRPYTPRHNGKVERSHREDQKRFYNKHHFYSLADFENQLSIYLRRSNNMPMRPLHWLSPSEFLHSPTVQYV
jgi:transposase InsO family protein